MRIPVPDRPTSAKIIKTIDRVIADLELIVTMRAELKSFSGSTHWHLKRDHSRGTLEITWWPKGRKLWIKIQAGRSADWIDEIAPRIRRDIEARLATEG